VASVVAPRAGKERPIHNIVFDVGWVLVRLNYDPMVNFLRARGAEVSDRNSVLARVQLDDHESGRLHGHGLLEQLAGLAPQPVSLEEIHARWVSVFELEPAMVDLAHRLSERYRVFLLSNIGDIQWAHLSREYRLHAIGEGALPSFLAGVMKPHAGIYAEAERRFALEPAATLFIDDRADNIEGARARGWCGIVHQGYPSTVSALAALEIAC
jgi:FMN phosphatase YigB (HAD superfamily)